MDNHRHSAWRTRLGKALGLSLSAAFLLSSVASAAGPYNRPSPQEFRKGAAATNVTAALSNTTAGGKGTVTLTMTLDSALPQNSSLNIRSGGGSFSGGETDTATIFNFKSTTVSESSFTLNTPDPNFYKGDSVSLSTKNSIAAGNVTITMKDVVNPSKEGGYFLTISIYDPANPPKQGEMTPEYQSNRIVFGTESIKGTVLKPDGVTPLPGVFVGLNQSDDPSKHIGSQSDKKGEFSFFGLTAGKKYMVSAFPPGPGSPDADKLKGLASPDAVEVTQGSTTSIIKLIFKSANNKISGVVTYKGTSTPVTDASINAGGNGPGSFVQANVDSSGKFEMAVSDGTYFINISPKMDDKTFRPKSVDWSPGGQPKNLEIKGGQTVTANFEVLKATAKIAGTVKKSDGTVHANSQSFFLDIRNQEGTGAGGSVGQDGSFSVSVPAGSYRVSLMTGPQSSDLTVPETKVTGADGQTQTLALVLKQKEAKITGKVTDSSGTALKDVRLNVFGQEGGGFGQATTGADGVYTAYVTKGKWGVMMEKAGDFVYSGPPKNVFVESDKAIVSDINFQLLKTDAKFVLDLRDEDSNRVDKAFGFFFQRPAGVAAGKDGGGEFGTPIQPGQATTASVVGGKEYEVGVFVDPNSGYLPGGQVKKTIAAGETQTVTITLLKTNATIEGSLIDDATGKTATDIKEGFVFGMSQGTDNVTFLGTQLQNGAYKLNVRSGLKYSLGYQFGRPGPGGPSDDDSQYLSSGGPDGTIITVTSAGEKVSHNFTVKKATHIVTGKVTYPGGEAVNSAFVNCENFRFVDPSTTPEKRNEMFLFDQTDKDGIYKIKTVAGKYDCTAHIGNPGDQGSAVSKEKYLPPDLQEINLTDTITTVTANMEFKKSDGSITGTVKHADGTKAQFGFIHAWTPKGISSGAEVFNGTFDLPLTKGEGWVIGADSYKDGKMYRSEEIEVNFTGGTLEKNFTIEELTFGGKSFVIPESQVLNFDATNSKTWEVDENTTLIIPGGAFGSSCTDAQITASPNISFKRAPGHQPSLPFGWDFSAQCASSSSSTEASKSGGSEESSSSSSSSERETVTSFNANVTLRLCYDEYKDYMKKEGISLDEIDLEFYDETNETWDDVNEVQNTDTNCVDASLSHFTTFSLNNNLGSSSDASATESGLSTSRNVVVSAEKGDSQVALYNSSGKKLTSFKAYSHKAGVKVWTANIDGASGDEIITVPSAGATGEVRIFSSTGTLKAKFTPYKNFKKGVNIALVDLDQKADGKMEILTVPADGMKATVKVYTNEGTFVREFAAFSSSYKGGALLAATDFGGTTGVRIVAATRNGSGEVRTFTTAGKVDTKFSPFGKNYKGGFASLAAADFTGEGKVLIAASKATGGNDVRVSDINGTKTSNSTPYGSPKTGTKFITGDMLNGDGEHEFVTLPNSASTYKVTVRKANGTKISGFTPFSSKSPAGFGVAMGDFNEDSKVDLVFGTGKGTAPKVKIVDSTGKKIAEFKVLSSSLKNGINVTSILAD